MRLLLFGFFKNNLQFWEAVLPLTLLVALLTAPVQAQDRISVSPTITGQVFNREGTSVAGGRLLFNGAGEREHPFEVTESGTFTYFCCGF